MVSNVFLHKVMGMIETNMMLFFIRKFVPILYNKMKWKIPK